MKTSINQWAIEDRPREKLELHGADTLSDAELLAILIGSGNSEQTAVDLSRDILSSCDNNLNLLGKLKLNQLEKFNGIGKAKAITIMAACELGRRRQAAERPDNKRIQNSEDIYEVMHPKMQDLSEEEGWGIYLNRAGRIIKTVKISHGGINATLFDVRLLLREAISCGASLMVMCHNHPSNNPKPSSEDEKLTEKVRQACKSIDVTLLDHLIVCDGKFYSFHDDGKV